MREGGPSHRRQPDRRAENEVVLITKNGISLRFHEEELRDQGRDTVGVWGIPASEGRLRGRHGAGDPDSHCSSRAKTASASGRRSTTTASSRAAAKGFITMKTGDKTGDVIGALTVTDKDELMLITTRGRWWTRVREIRETSRNTMGVN